MERSPAFACSESRTFGWRLAVPFLEQVGASAQGDFGDAAQLL